MCSKNEHSAVIPHSPPLRFVRGAGSALGPVSWIPTFKNSGGNMLDIDNHEESRPARSVSRRTLVKGAAWSIPVIAAASAIPHAAASVTCGDKVINWNQVPTGTAVTPGTLLSAAGSSVTATVTATGTTTLSDNLHVLAGPDGGLPGEFLNIGVPGGGQFEESVTVTFSQPVTNVSFTLGDIDSYVDNAFQESVSLSPQSFSVVSLGSEVTGSGTSADPWLATAGQNVEPTDSIGNVTVLYPGPLLSFTITLKDVFPSADGSTGHSIDLFDISFNDCP